MGFKRVPWDANRWIERRAILQDSVPAKEGETGGFIGKISNRRNDGSSKDKQSISQEANAAECSCPKCGPEYNWCGIGGT